LKIPTLLELDKHKIEYRDTFTYNGFLFKHGDITRKFSGYTSRGEFERENTSGVSGHTHRLGAYYTTKRSGRYIWVESGCLCSLSPDYIQGVPDWQHGISLVVFKKYPFAYPIPIVNYLTNFDNRSII